MNKKIIVVVILTVFNIPLSLFLSAITHLKLANNNVMLDIKVFEEMIKDKQYLLVFLFIFILIEIIFVALLISNRQNTFESSLDKITDKISTPVRIGQGQHGSSRWLTKKEFEKNFKYNKVNISKKHKEENTYKNGGLVVGYDKSKKAEKIYYINDNIHSITVGATRSGKTRSVVLQTIGNLGLAGESMIISDPKAELFHYTSSYLENLGYKVVTLDFKNPMKSSRYNFLQPVINAVNENDYRKAEELAWDITQSLVGDEDTKMEKIWRDGEMAVIAGSIMSVVFENKNNPQYQNLTNVYTFISEMCRTVGNTMPINRYIENISPEHPASNIFGIARIAPEKTRGSFFTSALTTLRLFTSKSIYGMTCESEFNLTDAGNKKVVTYIILPDEKTTYYSLASLFVYQNYVSLVELADKNGGELRNRVNYILDEFR